MKTFTFLPFARRRGGHPWAARLAVVCLAALLGMPSLVAKTHQKPRREQSAAHTGTARKATASTTSGERQAASAVSLNASSLVGSLREVRNTIEDKGHLIFTGYAAGEYSITPSTTGFSLNQLHVEALGHAGDRLHWKAEVQLDHQAHWADVYVQEKMVHNSWLRVGQFKLPFSQESLSGNTTIESIERPQAVTRMVPGRENHGGGQELGGEISGDLWRVHGRPWLSYATGFFSGHTLDMPGGPRPRQAAFRLLSSPVPMATVAVDYARGSAPGQPWMRERSDLEAALQWARWKFQAEYLAGRDGGFERRGAYAQAAWRFLPQWDAFLLADLYRPNLRSPAGEEKSVVGGLNWYLTPTLRMQINEGVRRTRPEPNFKPSFLCQLQLRFR